ncbi:hypothetical protein SLA2020_245230 [Shorea laevis]
MAGLDDPCSFSFLVPYRSMLVAWGSSTHGRGRTVVVPTGSSPGQSYELGCLAWLAWMTLAPFLSSSHTAPCWLRGAARLMAEAARWWFLRDQAQDKAMSGVALHGWLG